MLSHVALVGGNFPGPLARLGAVLFVANASIDACALQAGSATCILAGWLPDHTAARQGIGVL